MTTGTALPARPGTVLFDLDGTILDSSGPVLASWDATFDELGLARLPPDELHRVIGPPMQHVMPELLAERGVHDEAAVQPAVDLFRATMGAIEVDQAVAYEGVVELLRQLHDDGRRLAVVTSKPIQSTEKVVPALGVGDVFVHLEGPDRSRPEPKTTTLARAVERLDVVPTDTVLVGDRHHDVEAGLAHGIPVIGVTWGGHGTREELLGAGAVRVVDTPGELAALLGG